MIHAAPAQLTVRLLGTPEALCAGTPLLLHDQKARALLYYLAATGRPRSRDYLASLLWSDALESKARHSLRSSLYHLRQALQARGAGDALTVEGDTVFLNLAADACDVTRFRRLLARGLSASPGDIPSLEQAIALYSGPLLQGFSISDAPLFEEWLRAEEAALRQGYLDALQRLLSLSESRAAWYDAIAYAQRLVNADPLSEQMQQHLIHLHLRIGAVSQAMRQYREFEATLQQELGVAPAPETWAAIAAALEARREAKREDSTVQTVSTPFVFLRHLSDLLAPTASPEELWRFANGLGQVYTTLGQLEEAAASYERALVSAEKMGDVEAQILTHYAAGELALVANKYEGAVQSANQGLRLSSSIPVERRASLMARGHRLLGAALAMEGSDLSASEHHLQEAVAAHRLCENREDLCAVLFELGNVAAQRGEIARALELYEEAAQEAEAARVYYFQALAYNNLAYHHLLLGHLAAAQYALTKGYALAETHQMFGALLHLASTRGEILLYREEWAEAWTVFQHGLALAEELGNLERQAGFRAGLALAARGQKRLDEAIQLLDEALLLISERGYWHLRTRLQLWLAETLLLAGQSREAELHLTSALKTAREHGRAHLLAQAEQLKSSSRLSF